MEWEAEDVKEGRAERRMLEGGAAGAGFHVLYQALHLPSISLHP